MTQTIGLEIQDLLAHKRTQTLAIAEQHGAFNVRVFGSVARGEATIDSDVDFLIDILAPSPLKALSANCYQRMRKA